MSQPHAPDPRGEIPYRRNKYAIPISSFFILLAVIGLFTVGVFCVRFTQSILNNDDEKQRFERLLLPVVMFDPVPFESVQEVDPLVLLRSSLWAALISEKRGSYEADPLNRLIVPASDVDVQCASLFGTDIKLEHQSFGNIETTYAYNPETNSYYVPNTGEVDFYTPSVQRIVKEGDVYTLTVGYMPPLNVFTQLTADESGRTQPDKYMLYKLLKVRDHFQLTAIQDMPSNPGEELIPYELRGSSYASLAAPQSGSSSTPEEDSSGSESPEEGAGAESPESPGSEGTAESESGSEDES